MDAEIMSMVGSRTALLTYKAKAVSVRPQRLLNALVRQKVVDVNVAFASAMTPCLSQGHFSLDILEAELHGGTDST